MKRKKYAAVGTGGRVPMFLDPIAGTYRDNCELVGLCDTSETRRRFHQERILRDFGVGPVPTYGDFEEMLKATQPDVVVVCTPDFLHHEFIIKSLDFGADVISEKPLTTDSEKANQIFEAVQRTGRQVRTTFNMRWTPGASKVREIIASGEIGRVRHVDFEYLLNTSHGADYFRRWHSQKECSGGLLVHKATHHFDMINWWIDAIPSMVFAVGGLVYYGKANAIERGDQAWTQYDRYTGVAEAVGDPFRLELDQDPVMKELYLNAEAESGYIRDQNVFREGIDIEDSMSLTVKYRGGQMMSYSLNAYCPEEGFRAAISGDGGRIEYVVKHSSHIITGGRESTGEHSSSLRVQKLFSEPYTVEIPTAAGGHGGGDPLIQEQMFAPNPPIDPLHRNAGHEQGAASLLVGAAANLSIATGQPVMIDQLLALKPGARRLSELI